MPDASFRPRPRQPSPVLPWCLAGAAAVALGVVAVTSWRAADRQRLDGEGALRQTATEAAARSAAELNRSFARRAQGGKNLIKIRINWFQTPGAPDDWIFGPWPQPETNLGRAFDEVRTLHQTGKPDDARLAFSTPGNLLHDLGPFPAPLFKMGAPERGTSPITDESPSLETTAAGLPLEPLIIREQMHLGLGDRRLQAFHLLQAATDHPSSITTHLMKEAAAVLGTNPTGQEADAIATARTKAQELEALRTACRAQDAGTIRKLNWLDNQWYLLAGPEDLIYPIPLREIRSHVQAARLLPGAPSLPHAWSSRTTLAGTDVNEASALPAHLMGAASSGPWRVEVVSNEAAPFVALQSQWVRQRWLIGGATGAIWTALGGFLLVLARQRRLNAMMSNFVASVSHELRAPIGSIGLLAERLGNGQIADAEEKARYHQLIRGECRRLSGTIENVLSFSRLERGQTAQEQELSDLTALVRDTAELLRPLAEERRVTLTVSLPEAPLECEIDPGAIRQAVLNLLDNALKFSPPDGTIRLSLTEMRNEAIVTVGDDGPGVPEAERVRIFDPFYRIGNELRRETPGIGIGLAIVRHAALAHGGSVSVGDRTDGIDGTNRADGTDRVSKAGTGAVFQLRLKKKPEVTQNLKPET